MAKKKPAGGSTVKKEGEWYSNYCTKCSDYFTAIREFGAGSNEVEVLRVEAISLQKMGECNNYTFPIWDSEPVKLSK